MNLDDVLKSWRSQDQAPLYEVDSERLRQALRQELAAMQRGLVREARVTYGVSALMLAGMAFLFLTMAYDDDPRTWWDFVIVILGAAAFVLWAGTLYVSRKTLALRRRHFGGSLRDEIGLNITLLDYIGRTWRPGGILLGGEALPVSVGAVALILAAWRVNNEPFSWWVQGGGILVAVGSSVWSHWVARRKAERETLPRKRRLEALLEELDARR